MATNLKGKGRFVSILLLHGEKIAIALVGALALWFVYKALYVPKLGADFQADKLQAEITQTNNAIKEFTWDTAVSNFKEKIKQSTPITAKADVVNPADYVPRDASGKPNLAFDESIVAPLILRSDPLILNAVDVRATGGSGLLPFVDEKIRAQQAIKMAEEQKEAERLAADKAKRDAARNKDAGGPGGNRRGRNDGPENNEVVDKKHPKRRMVQGSTRPAGNALQGGERIERAYWACVTAKVPIREQLKLYQDALQKARGADDARDFPSYAFFLVERAEVVPGKELAWESVPLYDGQRQSITSKTALTSGKANAVTPAAFNKLLAAAQSFWAGGVAPDVVDARYSEFPLTLPLPPIIGREWGAEATHPDIPWGPYTPQLENENQPAPTATPEVSPEGGGEFGPAPTAGQQPGGPGMNTGFGTGRGPGEFAGPPGGFGARRFGGPEGGMGPGMPGPGMGAARFGPGGPEGAGPGGSRSAGSGQAAGQHQMLTKGVDYYLLRFFDFSVEPGKKYKYRVKVALNDPNFGLDQHVLDAAVLDRQAKETVAAKARKADKPWYRIVDKWSDASPAVGIPMAGNVRLADVKITPDEPVVKLLVEAFDVDADGNPIQAALEKDVRRGYVANMVQDAEYLVDPTMIDTQPGFKFFTGMTLLDVDGGGKLYKDMNYPARALVMGAAGELYIRSDTEDKPYVDSHRMIFEKTKDGRGGPGGPEVPGGPGGPRRPSTRR